ncbi:MAG: lysylphosphatidylglycerol synthase transmembrane domain-containing protein [Hyphomicrobiaceae bacterium]|nr:lysylphosphatidylglycerol synthase transmembrane domain-containing protein [Hyphomicrobiaceae bacterium]
MRYAWSALGIVLSAISVYYFLRVAPDNLASSVAANASAFYWAALVLLPAYILRGVKTYVLLNEPTASKRVLVASLYASIAVNNVLPFRMGDVLRLIYLRGALSIGLVKATTALLFERVFDLVIILSLFMLTIVALLGARGSQLLVAIVHEVPAVVLYGLIAGGLAACVGAVLLRSLAFRFAHATIGTLGLTGPRMAVFLTAAVLQWVLEILVLGFVLSRIVPKIPTIEGLLSSFMSNLSTLIPSAPGYVGTFDVAGILPFKLLSSTFEEEYALYVVLYHLVIWAFSTGLGALAGGILLIDAARSQSASGSHP